MNSYSGDEQVVTVRDKELRTRLTRQSLSGNTIPRVALPRFTDHGELLRFLREEMQGSFIVDELTDLVEEAVLAELEAISERGGVLGAMDTGYQRGKIQDESMLYERRKHDGSLPIAGVNKFRNPHQDAAAAPPVLARGTAEEKASQLARVRDFQQRHAQQANAALAALAALKDAARSGENVFAVLMDAAGVCSLQQITEAFFEVGGKYRRNV